MQEFKVKIPNIKFISIDQPPIATLEKNKNECWWNCMKNKKSLNDFLKVEKNGQLLKILVKKNQS